MHANKVCIIIYCAWRSKLRSKSESIFPERVEFRKTKFQAAVGRKCGCIPEGHPHKTSWANNGMGRAVEQSWSRCLHCGCDMRWQGQCGSVPLSARCKSSPQPSPVSRYMEILLNQEPAPTEDTFSYIAASCTVHCELLAWRARLTGWMRWRERPSVEVLQLLLSQDIQVYSFPRGRKSSRPRGFKNLSARCN